MNSRRLAFSALFIMALAALAYWVSPYWSVARFARAVQAGDGNAVLARIDTPAVRRSVSRQIARAYLAKNPELAKKSPLGPQVSIMVVGGAVDAYLAETFTPEAVKDMLIAGRQPGRLQQGSGLPTSLAIGDLRNALTLFKHAGFTGLASFGVATPQIENASLHLGFGVRGLGWKLVDLRLPPAWLDHLVSEVDARAA